MTIICDSREQKPYVYADSVTGKLDCADYSLAGAEHLIGVERKELGDLINCLCRDRQRFEAELQRMKALDYGAVVVEASLADVVNGRYRSNMNPKAAVQSLIALSIRYGTHIWFAGDRACGGRLTESILDKFYREQQKRLGALEGGE